MFLRNRRTVQWQVVVTERLILTPYEHRFDDEIFATFTTEVTRYMLPSPAKSIRVQRKVGNDFLKGMKKGTKCIYAITLKSGEFLGLCGIHHTDRQVAEFGIWLRASAHGNGYGKEAIQALYCQFRDCYVSFVYAVDERNIPSRRIAESIGGVVREGVKLSFGTGGNDLRVIRYDIPGNRKTMPPIP